MKCKKCKNKIEKDGICKNCGYQNKKAAFSIIAVVAILILGIGVGTVFLVLAIKNMSPQASSSPSRSDYADAKEYFENTSFVKSTIKADESDDVTNGKETYDTLHERGFESCIITVSYDLDGEYLSDTAIEEDSDEAYPIYSTYYLSKTEEMWLINVINGSVTAYPMNYNLNSEDGIETIIVENQTIMSYDSETNKFYETIPYDTSVSLKKVGEITTEVLDNLTAEEID